MTSGKLRSGDTTHRTHFVVWVALAFAACGGDGRGHVAPLPGSGNDDSGMPSDAADGGGRGGAGHAGSAGHSGAGGNAGHSGAGGSADIQDAGADAGPDPLAPTIQFMSPTAASDPNQDTVVTDASLIVTCQVTRADSDQSSPVNTSLIKITLEHSDDPTMVDAPPVTAMTDDLYQATFNLSARANGKLRFHCTAQDLSATPHRGSATLDTLLDLGPTIEFISPKDKGVYALKTPLAIQVQVTPAALSGDDNEAKIATATLTVGGVDTPLTESTTTPGLYQATIDFNDKTKFTVPPSAAQIDFAVSDARTPTAPTRHQTIKATIDGAGPTIVVNSPAYRTIVGSDVTLQITASDPSGLQPGSLTGTVNSGLLVLNQWVMTAPDTFSCEFDSNFDNTALTQLTINVTATDTVGNQSTVAHQLLLDNLP
ncbi:MAG TPA: hypothetical protein VHZ95_01520, partial [Polyangiales bacterium]|nr:hypothetical protein [Polyangiales bacterium]